MTSRTGLEGVKLTRPPKGPELPQEEEEPKTEAPPSTKKRWKRSLTVAFTSEEIPHRLRDLALEWNLYAPDGKSPAVSYLVEYLLLPRLEEAEQGELAPPPRGWRADRRSTEGP